MTAAVAPAAPPRRPRLGAAAWLMYEAGRTPFFVLIQIYVFAPYFTRTLVGDPARGQAWWGFLTAAGAVAVALTGPVLGAAADAGGRRKPWLLLMTVLFLPAMCALWWARPGAPLLWVAADVALCGALFELSVVFHNALLTNVAPPSRIGAMSGASFGLGNLTTLVVLVIFITLLAGPHPAFGLSHADFGPERAAGILAAVWFAAFAAPLFLFTPDSPSTGRPLGPAVAEGLRAITATVRDLGAHRNLARYLLARMVFNDGFVVILFFSGIYLGGRFGWSAGSLTVYGAAMAVMAFIGGVGGGWLDDRIGSHRALLLSVAVVFASTVVSVSLGPTSVLWIAVPARAAGAPELTGPAEIAALVNGGVCTLGLLTGLGSSRTFLARLAPPDMLGECFGLFALSGNAMAFLAPLSVALVTAATGNQQAGLAVTLAFLGVGGLLLLGVRDVAAVTRESLA